MHKKHLMVIDPAVEKPAIESFNRISRITEYPVTYHLPALFGFENSLRIKQNVKGIIVLGSAASVHDGFRWQEELTNILEESFDNNIPVLGICYGHQHIAHICGGKVGLLWDDNKKQGVRNVRLIKDTLYGGACNGPMIYSHKEGITEIPENFEIIAKSDMVNVDGFASTTKPIWGFQTHIEATQAFIDHHNIPLGDIDNPCQFGHKILDSFINFLS